MKNKIFDISYGAIEKTTSLKDLKKSNLFDSEEEKQNLIKQLDKLSIGETYINEDGYKWKRIS